MLYTKRTINWVFLSSPIIYTYLYRYLYLYLLASAFSTLDKEEEIAFKMAISYRKLVAITITIAIAIHPSMIFAAFVFSFLPRSSWLLFIYVCMYVFQDTIDSYERAYICSLRTNCFPVKLDQKVVYLNNLGTLFPPSPISNLMNDISTRVNVIYIILYIIYII